MKRKIAIWLLSSAFVLLFGAGIYRSQEAPEPPEAPPAPEVTPDGAEAQVFEFGGAAWLGVTLKDVTAETVRDLKLPGEYGALVQSLNANSPAAKAGLRKGDVIVEFAGERVRSEAQLRRLIRETPPGRTVSLQVIRDGQARTLEAKLASRNLNFNFQVPEIHIPEVRVDPINPPLPDLRGFNFQFDGHGPSLGISGDDLTSQLAGYFGVKLGKGILVREVLVGSPAAKAGLKAGDVIVAVDGKAVATVSELRQALEIKPPENKRRLNLTIVRDRHEQTVSVEVEKYKLSGARYASQDSGAAADELRRAVADAKAQLGAAQLAMKDSPWQVSDQQRLLSEKMRQAAEEYKRAIHEEYKLQLQKQLNSLVVQDDAI